VVYGMTSFITEAGVRQGRVDADTAYSYRDSSTIKLIGMKLVFYEDDGRARATVVADSGSMAEGSQRMVAWGDVVLTIHGDGRKIESSELHYDPGTDQIWSDSATVLTRPDGGVTRGSSFRSDLSFNDIRIQNPRGAIGEIVF
jgi:LPS export ABC transporter protein LptC